MVISSAAVKSRYSGTSCATKPTRERIAPPSVGVSPSTRTAPASGRSRPMARCSSVVLPAPLGPTRAATRPAGRCSEQSRSAHRRRYRLPSPLVSSAVFTRSLPICLHETCPVGSSPPVPPRLRGPARPSGPSAATRRAPGAAPPGCPVTARPATATPTCPDPAGLHQALQLQLPVGLQHGVGVDRQRLGDLADRRQLLTGFEHAEPQRLFDLLHELHVGGDVGAAVQVELDHRRWPPSNVLRQ